MAKSVQKSPATPRRTPAKKSAARVSAAVAPRQATPNQPEVLSAPRTSASKRSAAVAQLVPPASQRGAYALENDAEDTVSLAASAETVASRSGRQRSEASGENGEFGELSPVALRLLQAASDMRESPDSYERAFLARQLIQCTFPHSDPGNVPIWSRTNGNLTLSIRPLYDEEKGEHRYPYGTIPRLFLYWMVTEAARTKQRRLYLGQTYPEFMRKLGLNPSNGGVRSDSRRLRDQIERMLRATISFKQTIRKDGRTGDAWLDMQIGPEAVLWWNFEKGSQSSLFESYIELSEKFFNAITSSPIPLDLRALRALRKSPLSLDLYSLICHKTYSARKDGDTKTIPWDGLHRQMGAEYKELRNFKQKVVQTVKKIKLVYPQMKVDLSETGLHIHPAPLAIPERPPRELLIEPEITPPARTRRRLQ